MVHRGYIFWAAAATYYNVGEKTEDGKKNYEHIAILACREALNDKSKDLFETKLLWGIKVYQNIE